MKHIAIIAVLESLQLAYSFFFCDYSETNYLKIHRADLHDFFTDSFVDDRSAWITFFRFLKGRCMATFFGAKLAN